MSKYTRRTAAIARGFGIISCVASLSGIATAQVVNTNPPPATTVHLLPTDPTALQGASSGACTVVRAGSTTADLVVLYSLGGTASNGVDYAELPGKVTIPAGFAAADIVIQPLGTSPAFGNRTVALSLQTNANYTLGTHRRAAVTIVDDSYDNAAPSVSITAPTDGAIVTLPSVVTVTAEAGDPNDSVKTVSFFSDDDLLGKVSAAPYSINWTNPPAGKHALFARATDQYGKSTLSTAVHITVSNAPPAIKVVAPAEGTVFTLPATVNIDVDATDSDDGVAKVQIYTDNRLLTTLTKAPYSITWTNVAPGKHTIAARAIDAFGQAALATSHFSVTNAAPSVTITAPSDGTTVARGTDLTLTASPADADGTIQRVSFYVNNRYLGAVAKAPWTFTWKKPAPGTYSITAVATDNYGAQTTSTKVTVTVSK